MDSNSLPDGVYFGCRPVTGSLGYGGHCAVQARAFGVPDVYQLIPTSFTTGVGINTFPSGTPQDNQFNWILIPGTDINSTADVYAASFEVEDDFSQQYYPAFGVIPLSGPAENSNTFACALLMAAGIQVPANFFNSTAGSPLASRHYPLLTARGDGCINYSPGAPLF
jgi:hypothetical protein